MVSYSRAKRGADRWNEICKMIKPLAVEDQDLENLSSLFRLLSDRTRLNILMLLAGGERNVTNLCEMLKLPQPTVSHHLGLLRMNNVIGNRRNGKQVFYMLNGRVDTTGNDSLKINVGAFDVQISTRDDAALGAALNLSADTSTGGAQIADA
jgi:ArsR family transcriptional regulator, zinc-responsive transcriptional repressor